jgi:hypothetical protein
VPQEVKAEHNDRQSSDNEKNVEPTRTDASIWRRRSSWLILLIGVVLVMALGLIYSRLGKPPVWLEFWLPVTLTGALLMVGGVQAYIYKKQWDAMQGQLNAMKEQGRLMDNSLAQNERSVKAAEKSVKLAEANRTDAMLQRQADEIAMINRISYMGEQAQALKDSLEETRKIVAQNERAVIAMERSVETAQQSLYISERPYVELTKLSVELPIVAETPIIYGITIENKGRTPAYETQSAIYIDVRQDPLPESPNYRPLRTGLSKVTLGSSNPMITKQTTNFVLPQDVVAQVYAGEWMVYVYGVITYKDKLRGDTHRTKFCSVFNPEENYFVACDYHNDSD